MNYDENAMKQEEKIRVIVDVNIWISFLIGRRLQRIFDVLVKPQIVLIFSKELLDELYAVTQRPKFKNILLHRKMWKNCSISSLP